MANQKLVMANWKMNTTYSEAMVLISGVLRRCEDLENVKIVFFPPSIWLVPIKEQYKQALLGAQNIYSFAQGPYTGEISAEMLRGIAKYALVGHSERRTIFNEDDSLINAKLHAAFRANLIPVMAVGEEEPIKIENLTDEQILDKITSSILGKSLLASTRGLKSDQWEKLIISYEPIWAIGTGHNASGEYAARVIRSLRQIIKKEINETIASDISILYGGSVTRHNAADYAGYKTIDGVLVGGASLKIAEFSSIAESFSVSNKWDKSNEVS